MRIDSESSQLSGTSPSIPEFYFPMRKEMLCDQPMDPKRFWVQDRLNMSTFSEERIHELLDKVSGRLCTARNCLEIQSNDVFDNLFSILYYLEEY